MDPVDFRTSYFFPAIVRIGGYILIAMSVVSVMINVTAAIVVIIIGLFISTSHYRLKVDLAKRECREYQWIFGFTPGETHNFDQIEYIFINRNKVTQKVNVRVASTSYERYDYNAYLKLSERLKIHLSSDENKKFVLRSAEYIAARLKCEVVDTTFEE